MGLLKIRKNKKFGYTPRHFDSDKEGSPFQIEHKFDKFRSTVGENKGLKGNFQEAMEELKNSRAKGTNKTILFIVALLVFLFLYIIDFDLSIFRFSS